MSATHTETGAGNDGVKTVDSAAEAHRVTLVDGAGAAVNPAALPTGAATAARQDTGNASLSNMEPAGSLFAVTPHDATNFATNARALYVGGAGNVAVVAPDDTAVTFVGVPAGTFLPVKAKRVNATNTTATDIVGMY